MIIKIKRKTLEQGILSVFILFAIVAVLIGVSFTTNYVTGADNITNMTVIAKVNVTNTQPNITNIWIDDSDPLPSNEIDLTSNGATVVTCNATVYDINGFEDITGKNVSNATFYINSVGADAQDEQAHGDVVTAAKGADDDEEFTEKNAEGRKAGDAGKSGEEGHKSLGHAFGQDAGACDQTAAVAQQNVAG